MPEYPKQYVSDCMVVWQNYVSDCMVKIMCIDSIYNLKKIYEVKIYIIAHMSLWVNFPKIRCKMIADCSLCIGKKFH